MTVTKTKHAYYKLEKRFGSIVKIKYTGYKITIKSKDLVFYSDEEFYIHKITEEKTGLGINVEARDFEELEQIINEKIDFINEKVDTWIKEHPNHTLDKVEEWHD